MKPTPEDIAQAFVESCQGLPPEQFPQVCDAVLSLLDSLGLSSAIRTFPRLVRAAWMRSGGAIPATFTSATGALGSERAEIVSSLEQALKRTIDVEEAADPRLIGGIRVRVGDERFDATLRGALDRLTADLLLPVSAAAVS
ncbi:F0F1 ATP synthase subunit delta [Candidatus Peregrinibacteria bacterium]|nr:F0F1 ATP synthase subunit delta [Candidatus Peregrinibacteria bacterium]MBI3816408.1 F0F1 ATP synthase subunit delta [Candidatus Peregrinibacteria bacterium]